MPAGTRRAHNKTRLGCSNCKKRRIKCDCTHPICENCVKRGQECSFLLLAPSSQLLVGSSGPTSTIDSIPSTSTSPSSTREGKSSSPSHIRIAPKSPSSDTQIVRRASTQSSSSSPSPRPPFIALPDIELPPVFNTISPNLRCNDLWKDARETLSPALQGLLYHYEYTTSLTLAAADPAKTAWQTAVPELAARHQFLVHHILAIASLHIGRLHGDGIERWTMNNVAAAQMNKGLQRFRPQLENVNADNADALFASATLTAVYFFRTATMDIDQIRASVPTGTIVPSVDVVDKMMHCVLRTIHGLRGPLTILISGWMYVMEGRMGSVANRKWWPKYRVPATDQAREEDQRLADIEGLWKNMAYENDNRVDCLASALFYLRETFALVSQLTLPDSEFPHTTSISYAIDDTTVGHLKDRGAMFVWATRISRDFIKLIEEKNREALVIFAHYAVLSSRVRNAWWLEGLGANMITAVAMALGRENWHLIAWPVKVAGVDLENAFTARLDVLEGMPGEIPMDVI